MTTSRGEKAHGIVESMHRYPDLLEVVDALCPGGSLPDSLDGRNEQSNQHCDNGDHHEQFNQGKALAESNHVCTLSSTTSQENNNNNIPYRFLSPGGNRPASILAFQGVPLQS
jgi:hypothetical protein